MNDSALRKAAVLVASLDADTADLLLAQMPEEQADQVRRAVLEMGELDSAEQKAVVDEFFRIGPLPPDADPQREVPSDYLQSGLRSAADEYVSEHRGSIELNAATNSQINFNTARHDRYSLYQRDRGSEAPFSFLQDAQPEALVALLEREHPQAIALVLAHLPPERAGHILARLPANMQTDVIRRLVDLEETDPHVLRDVEMAVEAWFHKRHPARRRMAGVAAVSAILNASESVARRQILNNLTAHDRTLAHKLTPPAPAPRKFTFSQLCRLPIEALADVVDAADRRTAALALAGAPADLVADLLDCLELEQAESLSHRMTNLGPLRLSDIDRAQEDLAELASQLHAEGNLSGVTQSHLTAVV